MDLIGKPGVITATFLLYRVIGISQHEFVIIPALSPGQQCYYHVRAMVHPVSPQV